MKKLFHILWSFSLINIDVKMVFSEWIKMMNIHPGYEYELISRLLQMNSADGNFPLIQPYSK